MDTNNVTLINLTEAKLQQLIQNAVVVALEKLGNRQSSDSTIWLTRKEAAKHLKISLPTLDKLTRLSKIPVHRTERKKLYSLEELDSAIKILKIKYK